MQGKIKFWNEEKGYGFIIGEDEKDYFCHFTDLPDGMTPEKDDEVEFQTEKSNKGFKAVKVTF